MFLNWTGMVASTVHVGVKVTEVAHDHQVCVKKFVTEELGVINSYDTWHGTFLICLKNPF